MKKQHVFYLHTHDSGRYWSPYGYALPTPNIMKLAKDSMLFRHCYCTAPTCSPSRSGLLTGLYPHENGMLGLAHRGFKLNNYKEHLVHHLKENGFRTLLCGIQHVAPDHTMIGYDEVIGSQEVSMGSTEQSMEDWDKANTEELCTYLQRYERQESLFVSMGWFNTHREFPDSKDEYRQDYMAPPMPLYDCEENRKDMAGYHKSVQIVDECLGKLIQTLHMTGLYDSSIIIMTTDHGIAFPKMKCNLYDTGIGVACLLKYPKNPKKGTSTDALISHIDIIPTLCDLLSIPKPSHGRGFSLKPLIEGEIEEVRKEVFAEINYHAAYEPMRCVRTQRYKLIRHYDTHGGIVPANIDESLSKDFLMTHGLREKKHSKEYLFDLYLDPMERENLVTDENYVEVRNSLRERLDTWMQGTHDPLLIYGERIPKPPKAQVNKLSCENPRIEDFED